MATRHWIRGTDTKFGVSTHTVMLEAGDTSTDLNMSDYSDKTAHIYGTFGDSSVSVTGLNSATVATAQPLHRVNDPSLTFSGLTSELMALILENPAIIRASASGTTGSQLHVVIVSKRNT